MAKPKLKKIPGVSGVMTDDRGVFYDPTGRELDVGVAKDIMKSQKQSGIVPGTGLNVTATIPTTQTVEKPVAPTTETDMESQSSKLLQDVQTTVGGLKASTEEFTNLLKSATESYQQSFKTLQEALGEQQDIFEQQLISVQKQTGMDVDLEQPGFQQEIQQAIESGQTDFVPIMEKYAGQTPEKTAVKPAETQGVDAAIQAYQNNEIDTNQLVAMIGGKGTQVAEASDIEETPGQQGDVAGSGYETQYPEKNASSGFSEPIELTADVTTQVNTGLENLMFAAPETLESGLQSSNYDFTEGFSAQAIETILLNQKLNYIDDSSTADFLARSLESAKSSYQQAISIYGEGGQAIKEMDKALEGEEFIPETYEGLSAKIYQQSKDIQLESIDSQRKYVKEQQDIAMKRETEKRNRLEGFLKAKLHAMGAQDSSAGLQIVSSYANAADLRIQQMQSEYSYSLSKLNTASREVMVNYTNNITKLTMDTEGKKEKAAQDYLTKVDEIEGLFIENEREKNKLRMDALSEYSDRIYKMEQDRKKNAFDERKFAYEQIKDVTDQAYKLSGLTGTYHYVDGEGGIVDSGVETFDASKWRESQWLEQVKFEHTLQTGAFNKGMDLLDAFGSQAAPYAEELMGMMPGTLSQYQTLDEMKTAGDNWLSSQVLGNGLFSSGLTMDAGFSAAGLSSEGPFASCYSDGTQGGQCGTFVRTKFFDLPPMGDALQDKIKTMDNTLNGRSLSKMGEEQFSEVAPRIGDMVILDVGTWTGHVALVNQVNSDGTITLTESNWNNQEKVTNTRKIARNSDSIKAIHRGDLKPEFEKRLAAWQGEYDYAKEFGVEGIVANGINRLFNFAAAKQKATTNPFITQNSEYQAVQSEMAEVQREINPVAKYLFDAYARGESWAVGEFKNDPRLGVAYEMYRETQGATVDDNQKISDIYSYSYTTPTKQQQIVERATQGGYLEELNASIRGDYSGLLGEDSKYTEALRVLIKDTNKQKPADIANVASRIQGGDPDFAKKEVYANLEQSLLAAEKTLFSGQQSILKDMVFLSETFAKLEEETGYVAGNAQELKQLLGKAGNPELVSAQARVSKILQKYVKAQSGAAFSAEEFKRYESLFAGIKKENDLNQSLISSFYNSVQSDLDEMVKTKTGFHVSSFRDILPQSEYSTYFMPQKADTPVNATALMIARSVAANKGYELDVNSLLKDGYSIQEILDSIKAY